MTSAKPTNGAWQHEKPTPEVRTAPIVSEEWRAVIGFEGLYEVSNFGEVRCVNTGKLRRPAKTKHGYLHLTLFKDNAYHGQYMHRMVLEAFVGLCPEGKECLHLDDNKSNCRLGNLRWDTHSRNQQDAATNRRLQTKLSLDQVKYLRSRPKDSVNLQQLADEWGVTRGALFKARSGRSHKHVGD